MRISLKILQLEVNNKRHGNLLRLLALESIVFLSEYLERLRLKVASVSYSAVTLLLRKVCIQVVFLQISTNISLFKQLNVLILP